MLVSKITNRNRALELSELMSDLSRFFNEELVDKCKFAIEHYGGNVPVEDFNMLTNYTQVQFEVLENRVYQGITSIDFTWWYNDEEYILKIDIFNEDIYSYNMDTNETIIESLPFDVFLKF